MKERTKGRGLHAREPSERQDTVIIGDQVPTGKCKLSRPDQQAVAQLEDNVQEIILKAGPASNQQELQKEGRENKRRAFSKNNPEKLQNKNT